jgi:uncharacterized protein
LGLFHIARGHRERAEAFCRTDPARLKGIAMISLDDVPDAIKELERAARLGLVGAMIAEYPLEHRRYDGSEYEPFWAAAEALDLPLSLHTATRRQGRIRGAGEKRCATPAAGAKGVLSGAVDVRSDLLRFPRAASPPHLATSATARRFTGSRACPREGGWPALAKAGDGMLPSDFFRRNVVICFQEDALGIRLATSSAPTT